MCLALRNLFVRLSSESFERFLSSGAADEGVPLALLALLGDPILDALS